MPWWVYVTWTVAITIQGTLLLLTRRINRAAQARRKKEHAALVVNGAVVATFEPVVIPPGGDAQFEIQGITLDNGNMLVLTIEATTTVGGVE